MSNEEPTNRPDEPSANESWTVDDASAAMETPEERLTHDLDETAAAMTTTLNDLQQELTPQREPLPVDAPQTTASAEAPAASLPPALPAAPARGGADSLPPAAPAAEGSDDDRLMSGLAWLSMVILQLPIVSVIQLLSPNNRDRAFQRHHAVTSLLFFAAAIVYEIVAGIAFTLLTIITAGCAGLCLWVIFLAPHALGLYYAYQAYMGRRVELPVLSELGRKQGWL